LGGRRLKEAVKKVRIWAKGGKRQKGIIGLKGWSGLNGWAWLTLLS